MAKHGCSTAPATTTTGSKPVDGILTGPMLHNQSSGYLAFTEFSNHCGLWIDIPLELVFGQSARQQFVPPQARRLQCKDPRVVARYNTIMKEGVEKGKLMERSFALEASIKGPITESQAQEYEALDKLRMECSKAAEAKCRKLKMGQVAWSPEYQRALISHRFWEGGNKVFENTGQGSWATPTLRCAYRSGRRTKERSVGKVQNDQKEIKID